MIIEFSDILKIKLFTWNTKTGASTLLSPLLYESVKERKSRDVTKSVIWLKLLRLIPAKTANVWNEINKPLTSLTNHITNMTCNHVTYFTAKFGQIENIFFFKNKYKKLGYVINIMSWMTIYFFHKNELKLTYSDFGSQQKEKEEEEYVN